MILKTCETCACHSNSQCALFQCAVQPKTDGCPKHTPILAQCSICKNSILPKDAIIENESSQLLCTRCVQLLNTCACCAFGQNCIFETDPSPIPKVVQKEVRNGNMVYITQVRNPARIEATCAKCSCYDPEAGCKRELNFCDKYQRNS